MAQAVRQDESPYDSHRPDLTGRNEQPMANATGGDGKIQSRSGAWIALLIGVVLLIIAVLASGVANRVLGR